MGRSRGNFHADEDPNQRSRRKKNAASGDISEPGSAGQGTSEGKKALYHCNYCNKDITGRIRIKCAMCPDFDLCIECFSVGAEITPHKSNHPYRVMDNLSFPLICPDWNADDEILLLEGIEMYGLGNWAEVAEHVGTKNKEACIEHYRNVYLNSKTFPLPDMSHVVGKNRKELLAMAKGQGDEKKGIPMGDLSIKDESPFTPVRIKLEDSHKAGNSSRLQSNTNLELEPGSASGLHAANQRASNVGRGKGGPGVIKIEDPQLEKYSGGNKPSSSGTEGPSLVEMSGYNAKRQEFDPEYDNDAEQLLAEMEFKDTDTEDERELKKRILHIYYKRLDERKRRKDFILERNLLYPNPIEKDLTPEERTLCRKYDPFMRFHSKEDHDELLKTVIFEHRTRRRIEELQEARAAGCRSSAEADIYLEQKRRREAEESAHRLKERAQAGANNHGVPSAFMSPDSTGKDSTARAAGPAGSSSVNEMDVTGCYGADLLSVSEKRICCEHRMSPATFLKMQEILSMHILNGNVNAKSDAYSIFRTDENKVDAVYDFLVKKGIAMS